MKHSRIFVFSLILLNVIHLTLFAQDSDPCGCNAVLVEGIFSNRAEKGDSEAESDVYSYLASMDYNNFQKSASEGGGASFAGFGLNASMSKSQFEEKKKEFKAYSKGKTGNKSTTQLVEKYGDRSVLHAWQDCKANCTRAGGLTYSVDIKDENNMVLSIKFISSTDLQAKVVKSKIQGAVVVNDDLQKGEILPIGTTISASSKKIAIRRDDIGLPIIINIDLTGAPESIYEYIPKYIPPFKPDPSSTVITMTAKDLDMHNSKFVTNNDPTLPGRVVHDITKYSNDMFKDVAGWVVDVKRAGRYDIKVCFASDKISPSDLAVNGTVVFTHRLTTITRGFEQSDVQCIAEGTIDLKLGKNVITFSRESIGNIPHILKFTLTLQ